MVALPDFFREVPPVMAAMLIFDGAAARELGRLVIKSRLYFDL
jgi:hypothetical protein